MAREEAAERFWEYALSVYGQPEAQAAFLRLQDQGGADVPMLLWCLWCGAEGRGAAPETMAQAVAFSDAWRSHAVSPLRALRKSLKSGIDGAPNDLTQDARARVAQTEQAVERLQMTHLASLVSATGAGSPASMMETLSLYAKTAGLALDAADTATICGAAEALR